MVENLDRLFRESKHYKEEYMSAYIDIILRANVERLEEAMSRKTVEEVLIKTGWAAEFEARGKAQGEAQEKASNIKQILELLRSGKSVEELTRIYEEQLNGLSE
jgi:exo-beta-1,3-glucanase (GH17 family)